jgi:hypothetical protein
MAPDPPPPPAPTRPPVRAAVVLDPVRVNQAIDAGLAYLRGRLAQGHRANGDDSLLGLTFLECGVPARDPDVQQLAANVRFRMRYSGGTYSLSLAVFFLDRLNNPADVPLLRSLALRLAAGQTDTGDWGYDCPVLSPAEEGAFTQNQMGVAPGVLPPRKRARGHTDNSNTQFAVLALWIARRHGAAVQPALALAAQYFRQTQHADGSWAYMRNCSGISWALDVGRISNPSEGTRTDWKCVLHLRFNLFLNGS